MVDVYMQQTLDFISKYTNIKSFKEYIITVDFKHIKEDYGYDYNLGKKRSIAIVSGVDYKHIYVRNHACQLDNEVGPAYISICNEGVISLQFYSNGKSHRANGPAVVFFSRDGALISEAYFLRGNYHNKNGPASRAFIDGIWNNSFALDGSFISLETFLKRRALSI
jgi:hypothetical protein